MYLGNRVAEAKKISKFSNDRTYKISPNFNRVSKSNLTKLPLSFRFDAFEKSCRSKREIFLRYHLEYKSTNIFTILPGSFTPQSR